MALASFNRYSSHPERTALEAKIAMLEEELVKLKRCLESTIYLRKKDKAFKWPTDSNGVIFTLDCLVDVSPNMSSPRY